MSLHVLPMFIDSPVSFQPMSVSLCVPCMPSYICIFTCIYSFHLTLCVPVSRCIPCLCSIRDGPLAHLYPLQVHQREELEDAVTSSQEDVKAPTVNTLKSLGLPQPDFHSLILDLSTLSFVDTVCIKTLKNVRNCGRARTPYAFTLTSSLALSLLKPPKRSPLSSRTKSCPTAAL